MSHSSLKTFRNLSWIAVGLIFVAIALKPVMFPGEKSKKNSANGVGNVDNDGRVFVDLKWEHLPDVARFELIERSGKPFKVTELAGKPYAVNIFFAGCPTICRDFNSRIKSLAEKYDDTEMTFLSISCDAENDTPEVLRKYAASYQAENNQWYFLTGEPFEVTEVGEQSFRVPTGPEHHTDDIMLVDRWGRYRDRFKWDDPKELERFDKVLKEVLAEKEPPFGKIIRTRNVMASKEAFNPEHIRFLRDFRLTTSEGEDFFSRDLTGKVWVGSFFFTRCPGICPKQNRKLSTLQERFAEADMQLISITTDPEYDTAARLRTYARDLSADSKVWTFLFGNKKYTDRVLGEFFKSHSHNGHHSTDLVLMDRWGQVRGNYSWQDEASIEAMFKKAGELQKENTPFDDLSLDGDR